MSKDGFCKFHGPNRQHGPDAPIELTICSEIILSNLIYRLIQYFRNEFISNDKKGIYGYFNSESEPHLKLLNELSSLGTVLRKILVKYMLCPDFYKKKIDQEKQTTGFYTHKSFVNFIPDFNKDVKIPNEFKDKIGKPAFKNILNESLFWCIKQRFPESFVKFLLNLLPELDFKVEFTKAFINFYIFISTESLKDSQLLNISLISAQLFSNQTLANKSTDEFNLLPVLISTLYNFFQTSNLLKLSTLHENSENHIKSHYVVDIYNPSIIRRIYWQTLRDLVVSLSHEAIIIKFLKDPIFFNKWVYTLSCFEAMNLNERQFDTHIDYIHSGYIYSLETENDFSSVNWSIVSHLKDESTLNLTLSCIKILEKVLLEWLETIGIRKNQRSFVRPNPNQVTFHLPLHRLYSTLLYFSLFRQNAFLKYLMMHSDFDLVTLISLPLQTQIGLYEIQSDLWIRNGLEIKEEALIYIKLFFIDPDLFLVQLGLSRFNNHEIFMKILVDRFHLNSYFKIGSVDENKNDEKKIILIDNKYKFISLDLKMQHSMLTSLFVLLAQLICIKPNLDSKNRDSIRNEIIAILSKSDHTYSEIEKVMPMFGDRGLYN